MAKSPALDVEGVWKEWDADEEIRELLRSDKPVLPHPCSCDISTSVSMRGLLAPLLGKMALHEDHRLPPVDDLRAELELLFKNNKQGVELGYLEISKKSMAVKKLLGFVKTKARRKEVSTVTGWQLL